MLPKAKRLKKPLFSKVFSVSRAVHGAHLTLRSSPSPDGCSKFSFVVSKKVAPGAPKRNLLRRRGYAAVHSAPEALTRGRYGIFFFKKGAASLAYRALADEVMNLLEQAVRHR